MEESINQPTIEDDIRRQPSPTINDEYASTTYDKRKSAYLLAIRSLAFTFKMADSINIQIIIDDKNYLSQIKDRKPIATIGMVRVDLTNYW